jgi:AdoMet-dependent heme synthase
MSELLDDIGRRALTAGIPLSVHLDLTYRCNERCSHCYLDHDDLGEMSTAEIKRVIDQLAEAGVLFLTLSGGEIFLRKDLFELLAHARAKTFAVKLKTNGLLIGEQEAVRLRALRISEVQISIYSDRADVHDRITKVAGSLDRSVRAIGLLRAQDIRVVIANVLMVGNAQDCVGVKALAARLGVEATTDPTVTPKMNGDRSILALNVDAATLASVFRNPAIMGDALETSTESTAPPDAEGLDDLPCSAGHTACYISPYGEVFPCVQFPLPSGNVRRTPFLDIWRHSPALNEVRAIRTRDLVGCSQCGHASSCSRCPGLAYMEGNMRGPSSQDCEKSFARTGVPSPHLRLIQIQRPAHDAARMRPTHS